MSYIYMSYICHIMNVVPPCETSNSEMRSPCETHAKPMRNLYCKALLPMQCWSSRTPGCSGRSCKSVLGLNVSGCLWMSLDVSGLVQSCPGCNMSAVQEFTYADATFISFISFPLPGTFCRAATRYPASSLIGRAVKPSRPPNQWWMHGD